MPREEYRTTELCEAAALQASEYFFLDEPNSSGAASRVVGDHTVRLVNVEPLPPVGDREPMVQFVLSYDSTNADHFTKKRTAWERRTLVITSQHFDKRRNDTLRIIRKEREERKAKNNV